MSDTHFIFSGILTHLETFALDENFTQREVAASMSKKIEQYWMIMDTPSTVSVILDPRNKISTFTDQLKENACKNIQSVFDLYKGRSSSPVSSPKPCTPRSTRRYFSQLRKGKSQTTLTNDINSPSTMEPSELDRYLTLPVDEEIDPLLWWQAHVSEFPILCEMARDFLTIQATSVASEQAFSVAANTITKTRNRLLPETARACLCMKSWLSNNLVKLD
jgi:hypothetical protein